MELTEGRRPWHIARRIASFPGRDRKRIGAGRVWSIGDEFYATLLLVSYPISRIARILNALLRVTMEVRGEPFPVQVGTLMLLFHTVFEWLYWRETLVPELVTWGSSPVPKSCTVPATDAWF